MAATRHLRWGLLGTARINRSIIPAIRASKHSILIAVASRSPEKAVEYAATWNIPQYFSTYDDLLTDPGVDVIYNSLPNALHAEWCIKAMQCGKHVLCEKPLTTTITDAQAVIKMAARTGKVITEAFMYRHHPQTLLVKKMVDDGEIGSLQLIQGSFCYYNTRQGDTRFDPAMGGGSLWDIGCYPISYARFLASLEPTEVYGHQLSGPTGVDLRYAGQMIFPGGLVAQFECSFISTRNTKIELIGEKGRIIIHEPYKPGKRTTIHLVQEDQERTININGPELYLGEIEDIENAIFFGAHPRISLAESMGNIAVIEAFYQSARLSKSISLITG